MTLAEIRQLVITNLADDSDIHPVEHREVENAILDYIEELQGNIAKSKVITLDSFTTDRNYSIDTGFVYPTKITSVMVMLECIGAHSGYVEGDVVTAPTPYPEDSKRTYAQGIGVQYNNANPSSVKVMVNDQITIMTAYSSTSGQADCNLYRGSATGYWKLKLIIGYV